VLDDNSTDNTAQIIKTSAANDQRVSLIKGKPLPTGWLGKNWACWQLSQQSSPESKYLLFIDADTTLSPNALKKISGLSKNMNLGMLSIFPTQKIKSIGEWLTVPLMNLYLLSLLPLPLVYLSNSTLFASANGQLIMLEKNIYEKMNGHLATRSEVAEDAVLSRNFKSVNNEMNLNKHLLTIPDEGIVKCRMYTNYKEAITGFSKNFMQVITNSIIIFTIFVCLYILNLSSLWWIPHLLLIIAIRIFISIQSNQSAFINLLLHPLQIFSYILISIKAIQFNFGDKIQWKNREVIKS
jgi:chlorobactene glucosyltransferase